MSNPQIQNKIQINSENVMDDLMPETLTQPFMGMGDPRWYFGQIRLFPELGAPSPDPHGHSDPGVWGPPQASTQAQCGPQCASRLSSVLGCLSSPVGPSPLPDPDTEASVSAACGAGCPGPCGWLCGTHSTLSPVTPTLGHILGPPGAIASTRKWGDSG